MGPSPQHRVVLILVASMAGFPGRTSSSTVCLATIVIIIHATASAMIIVACATTLAIAIALSSFFSIRPS